MCHHIVVTAQCPNQAHAFTSCLWRACGKRLPLLLQAAPSPTKHCALWICRWQLFTELYRWGIQYRGQCTLAFIHWYLGFRTGRLLLQAGLPHQKPPSRALYTEREPGGPPPPAATTSDVAAFHNSAVTGDCRDAAMGVALHACGAGVGRRGPLDEQEGGQNGTTAEGGVLSP